jgi:small subunit ribosomal protein S6
MDRSLPKHRAREYETIFILNPESATEVIDRVAGRCQDVISKLEGKLLRAENWGKRRLAYTVRKHPKGIFIYLRYLGYEGMVHELERNLRMLDPVIKYLTVKVEEDVDPSARPVREEEISFVSTFVEEEREPQVAAEVFAEDAFGDDRRPRGPRPPREETEPKVEDDDESSDEDDL